ncbi:Solute carrier 2, facilitated glucose transporter member 5 [Apophysomyces ossiformis]|uniref:Solute carrier 2, facilitated glucose transporter member 5 n=1 Tax=Apophysomyces ossiformis TaxID=679940 RepID=A0A8H7EPJ7_9FUNG|nr:Solute carrier 2, facilitated glucose transporter member 5 [Apophysomyces ossiformis]
MFAIGGLIGALAAGPMASKFGRRDAMIMLNISFFIGAVLLSTATTSAQFAIGRIFVGIGSGFMTVVISMYIAEISPPDYRGALGSFLQLFMTFGLLIIQAVGLGLSTPVGWRVVTVITCVPAIAQMIMLPFCPRSPRWLISENRVDEARLELLKLRNGDIEEEFADMILALTKGGNNDKKSVDNDSAACFENNAGSGTNEAAFESEISLSFMQVMKIPVLAILTVKMMLIHAASQLTGINAIMYFSTSIFATSFGSDARYVTVGVAALNVCLTFLGLAVVDRLGRKTLLTISAAGMCLFGVLMCIALRFSISPLQVVCVMLFVSSFAVGLGMIPFVITAEVYPTYAVGAASSAALAINWLCNFIIGLIFPTLQNACGPFVFLIFAGISFAATIFIFLFVPETKLKSIEQVGREIGWADLDLQKVLNLKN